MLDSTDNLIKQIANQLIDKKWNLVTAESCTGGGLSYYLTNLPGSSAWFKCGWVTYSNEAKTSLLKVATELLATDGAVSEACALAMAEGGLQQSNADVSIAITGIAGPDGGSKEKPVGTVWLAIATKKESAYATLHHFPGDRKSVRESTIYAALMMLTNHLTNH